VVDEHKSMLLRTRLAGTSRAAMCRRTGVWRMCADCHCTSWRDLGRTQARGTSKLAAAVHSLLHWRDAGDGRTAEDKEQPHKEWKALKRRYLLDLMDKDNAVLERSLVPHKPNDLVIRCTEFDAAGNVKTVSGEFKKMDLCTQHGLLPRDLRKLDTGFHSIVPTILVRPNSILINLLHIRALVKADMVLLFDVFGSTDSHTQSVFMYDLEGKLRQGNKGVGGLPYELRALEAILISVVSSLDAEMRVLQELVGDLLANLEFNIDRDNLRTLLVYSKRLSSFQQKATLVRDALDEILDTDDDLAGMYLTEKLQQSIRADDDHAEVEMLIESYYKQTDEIVQIVDNLSSNIRNTEDIVNIILDANRNSIMVMELKVAVATLGIGTSGVLAGLYGMNVPNFFEESQIAFFTISGAAVFTVFVIVRVLLRSLHKAQRTTMWSEGSQKASKNWLDSRRLARRRAIQRMIDH